MEQFNARAGQINHAPDPQVEDVETRKLPLHRFAPRISGRIPSLDGLRAISILLVIVGHAAATRNFPAIPGMMRMVDHWGNLGVKFFFVISGFLITTLLLKELAATGQISLRAFYTRRALRIFPAFYTYWVVILVLQLSGMVSLLPGDLLHAGTYTMNYHHERAWQLNHIWSLSVEEQFYLLWPLTLSLAGPVRGFGIAAVTILAAPVIRTVMWFTGASPSAMTREFQAIAEMLAAGCLLAIAYNRLSKEPRYLRIHTSRLFILLPTTLLLLSAASYLVKPGLFYTIGQTAATLGIALLVDHFVRFPFGFLGRFLNSRPMVFIGVLSYSLYLWQELFLDWSSPLLIASFPYNIVLVAATSLCSYHFVEKPGLRLKVVLEQRRKRKTNHHLQQAGAAADAADRAGAPEPAVR